MTMGVSVIGAGSEIQTFWASASHALSTSSLSALGDGLEAGVVQQIHEVGLRHAFEFELQVEVVDETFSEIAQLDQRTLRLGVRVVLRIALTG